MKYFKVLQIIIFGALLITANAFAAGERIEYQLQDHDCHDAGYFKKQNLTGEDRSFTQLDNDIFWRGQLAKYRIRYTKWTPARFNGNVIIYNHGFQSHRAWFNETGQQLSALGYIVYAFDRIGSGCSSGGVSITFADRHGEVRRSIIRKRGHIASWQAFTHTIHLIKQLAKSENIGANLHLWANSYAAGLVTAYIEEYKPTDLDSVVFTSPGLFSKLPLPFSIEDLIISDPGTFFESIIPESDGDQGAAYFTSDPIYYDAIKKDKKSLRYVTREFYFNTSALSEFVQINSGAAHSYLPNIRRFYLLVHQDPIMDNIKMMEYIRANSENAIAKIYEGGEDHRHYLLFTEDAFDVLSDIDRFFMGDTVHDREDL